MTPSLEATGLFIKRVFLILMMARKMTNDLYLDLFLSLVKVIEISPAFRVGHLDSRVPQFKKKKKKTTGVNERWYQQ